MKTVKEDKHPEKKDDEIYLGNTTVDDFYNSCGWKSKRLGDIAYDSSNKILDGINELYPFFVKKEEMISDGFTILKS